MYEDEYYDKYDIPRGIWVTLHVLMLILSLLKFAGILTDAPWWVILLPLIADLGVTVVLIFALCVLVVLSNRYRQNY